MTPAVVSAPAGGDWSGVLAQFLLLSLLSIGGAISTVPEMHRFLVDQHHWPSNEQFNVMVAIAQAAPGTKQSLYWGFLERGRPLVAAQDTAELRDCLHCGQPTTAEVCAFCRMTERAAERMRVRRAGAAHAPIAPPESAPAATRSTGG